MVLQNRATRLFFVAAAALFALTLAPTSGAAPTAAQTAQPFELGGQILALSMGRTPDSPDYMHDAGMTWVKMQLKWTRDASHDEGLDAQNIINHGARHGFKVLLSIKGSIAELDAVYDSGSNSQINGYYDAYAAFVARVADMNPDAIEIWNEPNLDREWPRGHVDGGLYADLLERAYPAIKAANPNVMVISGAPSPTGYWGGSGCDIDGCNDDVFIRAMRDAGASSNMDCVGMHYNEGVVPPTQSSGDPRSEHYSRYYSTMINLYSSTFPGKPLCFTELGYLSDDGLGTLPPGYQWGADTSVQEQAQWLAQAAQLSRDGGKVRLMIIWNMDATTYAGDPMAGWAIIRPDFSCLACTTLRNALQPVPQLNYYRSSPVRLTWNRLTWAINYHIQVDDDPAFGSPLIDTIVAAPTLHYNAAIPADGTYYWRARGQRRTERWGPYSAADSFVVDLP